MDGRVGSFLRPVDSRITELKAHGPSRTCNASKEEGEEGGGETTSASCNLPIERPTPVSACTSAPLTHSSTYSLTRSRTHSLAHSLTHALTHSLNHSLIPSLPPSAPALTRKPTLEEGVFARAFYKTCNACLTPHFK